MADANISIASFFLCFLFGNIVANFWMGLRSFNKLDFVDLKLKHCISIKCLLLRLLYIMRFFLNNFFSLFLFVAMFITFKILKIILFLFIFIFISIFILLICRKETEALTHRVSNYPDLLSEMPRYCCPLKILIQ